VCIGNLRARSREVLESNHYLDETLREADARLKGIEDELAQLKEYVLNTGTDRPGPCVHLQDNTVCGRWYYEQKRLGNVPADSDPPPLTTADQ
jgi:hypothetical protein